jgi:predicted ATP-binding protein involved in virulence
MRIDKVEIPDYKNLKKFFIDINERKMKTVLLGKNASGKSNFFEALVIIFRDLDLNDPPGFNYRITYNCNGYRIEINADTKARIKRSFSINGINVAKREFYNNKNLYFPRYLFAYYSGLSNRLESHFDKHQKAFYKELLQGNNEPIRPLFYAQLVHSNFVLMAFYSFEEEETKRFLEEYMGIVGLESILFVLKEPEWTYDGTDGDERFWNARGKVKEFLADLYDVSLAPIRANGEYRKDFLHTNEKEEHLYLYISNDQNLKRLAGLHSDNVNFFKMLESTYMSDLIREVRIKVKKKDAKGNISFKELSEGEQQLLTVLGLLRFTKTEESLVLLDEPDTHLNPLWKWEYMDLLEKIVKRPETTQILMTTHDPLVIGGLEKEEIRIFNRPDKEGQILVEEPFISPKGLGVAGILTSDLFGLPTILDKDTQQKLDEKRYLQALQKENNLKPEERERLKDLETELEKYGFSKQQRDPLYQRFLENLYKTPALLDTPKSKEEKEAQDKKMISILEELLLDEKPDE